MKNVKIICTLLILIVNCSCKTDEFGVPNIVEVKDSTSMIDPYMGDWLGKYFDAEGTQSELAVQVIALDDKSNYRINLLHSFNTSEKPFAVVEGVVKDEDLHSKEIAGSGFKWDFQVAGSELTGKANNGANFSAKRVRRVSPTLGLKAPVGATILFDGSSLDNWQLMRDFNGHLQIPGINTGNCCNYLKTRLWSDLDQKVVLQTAHNSMMKFWLNNDLIYYENAYIAPVRWPNINSTDIILKKGWNDLFVKIVGYNVTSAAIKITSKDGKALTNIAEHDLSSGADGKTREFLDKADQNLTVWQYSGHYFIESSEKKNLMTEAFAHKFVPESDPAKAICKPLNVTLQEDNVWPMNHRIVDGSLEIYHSGDVMTKQGFGDYYLHLEFRIPFDPNNTGQYRGNSGVYLACMYEIQVLDSYGLVPTKQDCGAAYYIKPPDINMSLPPLQWQTYDIFYTAPRFDKDRKKIQNANATIYHNGVMIQDSVEFPHPTGGGMKIESGLAPIHLQNHGARVLYRNMWIVEN